MDNYLTLATFMTAANQAPVRKVLRGGIIYLAGRKYQHDDLRPYIGQYVRAFPDLDGADSVCLTLFDGHFICNAHNLELWAAMLCQK